VRIVNDRDESLPVGEVGEICVRSPFVMLGYWRDPELTVETTRGGWLHTGDLGYLDEDGYLFIVDRLKDMIISGGENIYPAEVEAVLARHPAVADVAVLGRQDPTWGEAVHAVIIPAAGAAVPAEEIIAWCRDQLAHFKCPKSVEFTDSLPRTTTGKVLKRDLRAQLASASQRAAALSGLRSEERGTSERATREGSAS
jgi:long-chain acyl-CoA synthetase